MMKDGPSCVYACNIAFSLTALYFDNIVYRHTSETIFAFGIEVRLKHTGPFVLSPSMDQQGFEKGSNGPIPPPAGMDQYV